MVAWPDFTAMTLYFGGLGDETETLGCLDNWLESDVVSGTCGLKGKAWL